MSSRVFISELIIDNVLVNVGIEPEKQQGVNYYSIITGRNGAGKSRILEAISFCILFMEAIPLNQLESMKGYCIRVKPYHFTPTIPFKSISLKYYVGGALNQIVIENDIIVRCSRSYMENESHPKLICLSNSLFNRFFEESLSSRTFPFHNPEKYKNFSIYKDAVNAQSFSREDFLTNVLSREIIRLFFSDKENYIRSLNFLRKFGVYDDIFLSLNVNRGICGATVNGITDIEYLKKSIKGIIGFHEDDNDLIDSLSETLGNVLLHFSNGGGYILNDEDTDDHHFAMHQLIAEFYFSENSFVPDELRNDILFLSENNILIIKHLNFNRNGEQVNLNKMSSGEVNIFLMLMKLHSEIENNSIIMIDEPEISLHPAWQNEVIPSLEACFSQYTGCHFIIATHSPQVVASVPYNNSCVVMLDDLPSSTLGKEVHGKSSDYQLFRTLNYAGYSNEYIVKSLLLIIAKIDSSKPLSNEDLNFIKQVENISKDLDSNDVVKYLLLQTLALVKALRGDNE